MTSSSNNVINALKAMNIIMFLILIYCSRCNPGVRLRALTAQNEGDPGWGGEKTSSSLR